jgi:hypothetical protein
VPGLSQMSVANPQELHKLLDAAARVRSTASTKCNDVSSRSHFLFRLKITGVNEGSNLRTEGELNLVDLAGSERVKESQVSGKALEEAKFINKSLTSLGDVISGAHPRRAACTRPTQPAPLPPAPFFLVRSPDAASWRRTPQPW